jgi:hypothetical protein
VAAELGDNRIDVGLGIEAMVHGCVRKGKGSMSTVERIGYIRI